MTAKAPNFQAGDFLPGTKYRIVKELGAGGMGVVYQVVKPPNIQGVLKLMSTELAEFEEFRTRFLDEVRVLAQLDHPNIVKVFDYDKLTDGTPFYVMELLHGRTVRDVIATMGVVPPRVAFEITRQLCEALHCAHTHDIPVIHRDIKPENIFLHAPKHGEPVVKLIDFGVVAVADRQHDNAFVGTWKYAAPEQIRGERATPATDLYAVGLVLYEMLCGIGPFEELEGSAVAQAHMRMAPPPITKFASWVPPSIVQLIASSLAKDARQRPRDAYAFSERLFELEWASDGTHPPEKTAEGPLSRVLSSVGGPKVSSKRMAAAAPAPDRLGDVPLIGVPEQARHGGPTLKGVGQDRHEPTSPGEDALLAGLGAAPEVFPSKKARESDRVGGPPKAPLMTGGVREVVSFDGTPLMPPVALGSRLGARPAKDDVVTLDAPPTDPGPPGPAVTAPGSRDASTLVKQRAQSQKHDTDTFATQESDTRRAKARGGKWIVPVAFAAIAALGIGSFVVLRMRGASDVRTQVTASPVATTAATVPTTTATTTTAATTATTLTTAPPTVSAATEGTSTTAAKASASASGSATKGKGVPGKPGATTPVTTAPTNVTPTTTTAPTPPTPPTPTPPATTPATAPKPTSTADPSFIRKLD
ncbi:MAG: serine/threonine protein kinase [Deltaproteobacteria bacterium]|nr:serine/threonine protein kinase [Deltaproteobacteria bacterium]